jgi:hypothetical protein
MLPKPSALNGIGLVQLFLAGSFVIWLLFFPGRGDQFAWPVVPPLTAMFIGASFTARAYLGYHLWREKQWWRLRWQVWGNLGFLAVIFAATFWHVDEMNWATSLFVAHVWVLAYAVEPLVLILVEPRGPEANATLPAHLREGPISPTFKRLMATVYVVLVTLAAIFFLNPEFADTRWPWPLDPFDARIMAAFMILPALFALKVYFLDDWAEAKLGVRTILIQGAVLSVLWLVTNDQYRELNRFTYGLIIIAFTLIIGTFYWWHATGRNRWQPPSE